MKELNKVKLLSCILLALVMALGSASAIFSGFSGNHEVYATPKSSGCYYYICSIDNKVVATSESPLYNPSSVSIEPTYMSMNSGVRLTGEIYYDSYYDDYKHQDSYDIKCVRLELIDNKDGYMWDLESYSGVVCNDCKTIYLYLLGTLTNPKGERIRTTRDYVTKI